ncbi:hypothetical protein KC131_26180 [Pseudomonas sp. JQ170]|uniref:hypothetical protein n=1 Tax=unclassified Pseudomonas TaxID=196821 RepID=UPI00264DA13A|nr:MULTISPECIES: hypothetical protein [unclassified Pseudomonas]MDN7144139.1 hypothetical protein [Pseudomonas sp. JQ170]WRO77738.1 hypothetical protein U9R80_08690 [Pseudomonas sp. 170C]
MKKSHGPAFKKEAIELAQCPACKGKAVTKSMFYELACTGCNASGWVAAVTGEALPLEELVTQLSLRLQVAQRHINELKNPRVTGPEALYLDGNRRGGGGTNFTGD